MATPPNFKIAFIGDQGLGTDAQAVLQLIKNEGAQAVMHSGDLDYADDPQAWDDQISSILGTDFPYFASVGNHEDSIFYRIDGYQDVMEARMNRLSIPWDGDLGVKSSFHFNGIFFVLTASGIFGTDVYDLFIREQLAKNRSLWSVSSWHLNMHLMQVSGVEDETGWGVYEESRKGGAIIATAHAHTYSRTHLLSDIENQTIASTSDTLRLMKDDTISTADEGRTFVFVSALGGRSFHGQ
ncbi:MAG: metallophosphoesterase [bacterium]